MSLSSRKRNGKAGKGREGGTPAIAGRAVLSSLSRNGCTCGVLPRSTLSFETNMLK
jgi:hypothetical protein